MYTVDTGCDDNLMPFGVFQILFPKSRIAKLHATKYNIIMSKTYKQTNIDQLGLCTVKIRCKDKCVKCRFSAVPDDSLALLGMLDIAMLSIVRITCDIIGVPHENRKVDSQKIEMANRPSCRTSKALQIQADKEDIHDGSKHARLFQV